MLCKKKNKIKHCRLFNSTFYGITFKNPSPHRLIKLNRNKLKKKLILC